MTDGSRGRLLGAVVGLWAGASLLQASVLAAQEAMSSRRALLHGAADEAPLAVLALAVWALAGLLERRTWPVAVVAHLVAAVVLVAAWEAVSYLVLAARTGGHAAAIYRAKGLWMALNTALQYGILATGVVAVRATRRLEQQRRRAAELALHAREAELRALRAQIRPHFLFNVLNSIYSLVASRPAEAQEMIALLSDLLRRTLDAGDEALVPLEWELAATEAYLGIERIRLRERLQARVLVDGADRATPVPPLLLQPLVENAIKHGVARAVEGGRVDVEARRTQGGLEIVVRNDRPPATADVSAAAQGSTDGRSLALTRARLVAAYGGDFGMDVRESASLFEVRLRLPLGARAEPVMREG